jgi:hypothetical protein
VAVPVTVEVLPEPPGGAPPGDEPPETPFGGAPLGGAPLGGVPIVGVLPVVPVPAFPLELVIVEGDVAVVAVCGLHEVNIIANTIREPKIKQVVFLNIFFLHNRFEYPNSMFCL